MRCAVVHVVETQRLQAKAGMRVISAESIERFESHKYVGTVIVSTVVGMHVVDDCRRPKWQWYSRKALVLYCYPCIVHVLRAVVVMTSLHHFVLLYCRACRQAVSMQHFA
jgi:hypothetical protein